MSEPENLDLDALDQRAAELIWSDAHGPHFDEPMTVLAGTVRALIAHLRAAEDRVCELEGIDRIDEDGIAEFTGRALRAEERLRAAEADEALCHCGISLREHSALVNP